MLLLRDPAAVQSVQDVDLHQLLTQRFEDIAQGDLYDSDIHGFFVLVESGDSVADIEAGCGFPILSSLFNATHYGDPAFSPCFEVLEEHVACFEVVFVPSSGDFGVVVIVPKVSGIDSELLRFCHDYATPAPGLLLTG